MTPITLANSKLTTSSFALCIRKFHPHVEYQLTEIGREVALHIEGLTDWIQDNLGRILEARVKTAKRRSRALEEPTAGAPRRVPTAPPALANSRR